MLSTPTMRYRFRSALKGFVGQPRRYRVPSGPLILLADGMRFQFGGKPWVLYLTAVRPCRGTAALFLDPCLFPGSEGARRWERAFDGVPAQIRSNVRALVADNLNGMQKIAKRQRWVFQLCHFHLIHKLQFHRRGKTRALKGGRVREKIYVLVRTALKLPDGLKLDKTVGALRKRAAGDCGTRRMQAVLRDFLACLHHYRAYRAHPELDLPTTTNVMESMGGIIRDLLRRTHAANNPKSLLRWTTALIRLHPHLVCNGRHSTE
jgi:hypothetical protein